nr:MAG TPA: hypothetical protein [Bacteriophage sp.]
MKRGNAYLRSNTLSIPQKDAIFTLTSFSFSLLFFFT